MPIYEYQCEKCGKIHEITQRMTDAPLTKCPDCKGKMKKLLSLSGFQLKGGGWYKDGYSSVSSAASSEGAKEAPKPAEASPAADAATPKAEKKESPKPAKQAPKKKSSGK